MNKGLKPILIEVPKEMTVKDILLQYELDPNMYIVSKNDELMKLEDKLEEGQAIKVIPIIAGG